MRIDPDDLQYARNRINLACQNGYKSYLHKGIVGTFNKESPLEITGARLHGGVLEVSLLIGGWFAITPDFDFVTCPQI